MNQTQNIKDILLPLKVMWIGLSISIIINNIVYIYLYGLKLSSQFNPILWTFFVFVLASFSFVMMFLKKFNQVIKPVNTDKTPFMRDLNSEEKEYLKYYSKYFLYIFICWLINDLYAIVGFIISYLTHNYLFLFLSSILALWANLNILKPSYHRFRIQKSYHGE